MIYYFYRGKNAIILLFETDFRALIIERVIPNDGAWLLEREEMWIKRLKTKKPHGLNRID